MVFRPGPFGLLAGAGRVAEVSAPAGSGKTVLLRSWIGHSGLAEIADQLCGPLAPPPRRP